MSRRFICAVAALVIAGSAAPAADAPLRTAGIAARRPGDAAPDCVWSPLGEGAGFEMRQLRGNVVYVDFWASWCGACAKSFPLLNELDREFRHEGLRIVGVNLDEAASEAEKFLAKHPASFSVGGDPSQRCARDFGISGMPTGYLIGRDGTIRDVRVGFGPASANSLREKIAQVLAEVPAGS